MNNSLKVRRELNKTKFCRETGANMGLGQNMVLIYKVQKKCELDPKKVILQLCVLFNQININYINWRHFGGPLEVVNLNVSFALPKLSYSIWQGCQTYGPRAACGPRTDLMRPARHFQNVLILKKKIFWTTFFLEKKFSIMQSGPRENRFTPCGPWAEMSLTPLVYGIK